MNCKALLAMADALGTMSDQCQVVFKECGDQRLFRAHLILEEVSELLEELANRDEVKCLKELADVLYVVIGTAVAFDLPIDEAFEEVHSSNMTKGAAAGTHDGDRGKGEGYRKADVRGILIGHRLRQKEAASRKI